MDKDGWAYLAGLVDADGTIAVNRWIDKRYQRHRYTARLSVANCDKDIMDWLAARLGGSVCLSNKNAPKHHRPLWRWSVCGMQAKPLLEKLLPHLKIKQKRAELALQFIATIGVAGGPLLSPEVMERREQIFKHITRMNQRGRLR